MDRTTSPPVSRAMLALIALGIGGFAIGSNEFIGMGLLPEIAHGLLPDVYARSQEVAHAQAGFVISAYALGVIVGAPTIAALVARRDRKTVLMWLLAGFAIGNIASAILPSLGWIIAARFLTGLPHGAYFAVAALVATELLGPARRALAAAIVIGGLSAANVIGVPALTWLGQEVGWRGAYLTVAILFILTLVAVMIAVPTGLADRRATFRRELGILRHGQVWLALGIAAVGYAGIFAMYSYIAPLSITVTGIPASVMPLVLAAVGAGMTAGTFLGGWAADRSVRRAAYGSFAILLTGLAVLLVAVTHPVGLVVGAMLAALGGSGLGPIVQTRLMDVGRDGLTFGASMNHAAFNVANALGVSLGGLVIALGLGYVAPIWIGVVLAAAGLGLTYATFAVDRRRRAAGTELPYGTGTIPTYLIPRR